MREPNDRRKGHKNHAFAVSLGVDTLLEPHLEHELVNGLIPHARGLLQTVERSLEVTDIVRLNFVDVSVRLYHINVFVNNSVRKAVLTSIWCTVNLYLADKLAKIRIDENLATGANVSS